MNKIVFTVPKGGAQHPEEVLITVNGDPLGYVEEASFTLSRNTLKPIVTLSIQADVEFVEIEAKDDLDSYHGKENSNATVGDAIRVTTTRIDGNDNDSEG